MVKKTRGEDYVSAGFSRLLVILMIAFTITVYSCKKDEIISYSTPTNIIPADKGATAYGTSTDLKWTSAAPSGVKYNVYFGEKNDPALFKSDQVGQSLNVPVIPGHQYFWKVGTIDASGKEMLSPVYSFKVKMLLNMDKFTGLFSCSEPRYSNYDVNFSKLGKDTLVVDNFWDLKWSLKYVFDELGNVNIVPKTFTPDPSLTYVVTGVGTYNNDTGEFSVNYSVVQKNVGTPPASIAVDANTHNFKKKP